MREGLFILPKKVEILGDKLRENMQEKAARIPEGSSTRQMERKKKMEELSYLVDAYTSAMRNSLEQVFENLKSGKVTKKNIDNMRRSGLIRIKTDSGDVRWALDKNTGIGELDFNKIVASNNMMLPQFISYLDGALGDPEKTNDLLSKNKMPLDRNKLQSDPKGYGRTYGQKIHVMAQQLMDYVGPQVLDMMRQGEADKDTVVALFGMLKPHSLPKIIGPYLSSRYSNEERRDFLKGRVENSWRMYQNNVEKMQSKGKEPTRKKPSIEPEDVDSMSDAQIRATLFKSIPNDFRSRIDDYRPHIKYYGANKENDKWPGNNECNKRHSLAVVRYNILVKDANQIANVLEVRNKLIRYESVTHFDFMTKAIVNDARNKINKLSNQ